MSRDQHPGERDDEPEVDDYYDDRPRSIFSALWFRALLAILVLGVLAAVAVPYMLDLATHSTSDGSGAKRPVAATSSDVTATAAKPQPADTATPAPASSAIAASTTVPSGPATAAPAPTSTASTSSSMSTPAEPTKMFDTAPPTPQPARKVAAATPATIATKSRETTTERPRVAATKTPAAVAMAEGTSSAGPYWVQVGAFRDAETAKRVVTQLRTQGFRAEQSTTGKAVAAAPSAPAAAAAPADAPGDRYVVVVTGAAGGLDAKLAAKGMTSEATPGGTIVQPSLPLREAVVLSRELADTGLTVQVRRQGAPAASAPAVNVAAPSTPARSSETWHRVRVGGFADRAAALASFKRLEEKGYKPFIGTGTN